MTNRIIENFFLEMIYYQIQLIVNILLNILNICILQKTTYLCFFNGQ